MLFNSNLFLGFLVAFLLLYYTVRNRCVWRNILVLIASYTFYGAWDWRFTGLLALSSWVDYFVGLRLRSTEAPGKRKALLTLSLGVNLGALGFFKYFNFFADSMQSLLGMMNVQVDPFTLNVILPVGISFYTFQSLSYTIDVYRGKLEPTRDWVAFFAYVAFFPQLVAGPIERAAHLLPQFQTVRSIRKADIREGMWLLIWGMFKKVVIADNMAPLVDMVYQQDSALAGPVIVLATLAFGIQIYCDFSGYSDIARGVSKLLGFDLMFNFNLPYFATSPSDFWRRWHISLSTWFRDYLYIPLGGSRNGFGNHLLNLMLTMVVAGLWHGAGWNFLLWGAWHGLALCLLVKFRPVSLPAKCFGWLLTMIIVFIGWAMFRAVSMEQIGFLLSHFWLAEFPIWFGDYSLRLVLFVSPLALMQIWQARTDKKIPSDSLPSWAHYGIQSLLLYAVILFWETGGTPFIYFQF